MVACYRADLNGVGRWGLVSVGTGKRRGNRDVNMKMQDKKKSYVPFVATLITCFSSLSSPFIHR